MTSKRIFILGATMILLTYAWFLFATVNEVTARNDYTGDGSTTAFTYSYRVLTKTDIEVLVDGTAKTVDTDYTVSGLGLSGGGTVTFIIPPINGAKVALLRKQPAQQTSVYTTGPFPASRLEQDFDKLQMQVQQLKEELQRRPGFEKKSLLKDKVLPDFSAGKFLKVTDAGTGLEWVSPVTVGTLNTPSFTTGSVPFATGTATLGQDNANLFWDDGNNRLGIGTASPTEPLHVAGNAKVGGSGTFGSLATSGTSSSTKACATGYTRVLPNFCKVAIRDNTTWTDAVGCTSRTAASVNPVPADAKMALITLEWEHIANNTIAQRSNDVSFFNDAACTGAQRHTLVQWSTREWAAVTAGTVVDVQYDELIVPLTGTNTFHTTQASAAEGNGSVHIKNHYLHGYFD